MPPDLVLGWEAWFTLGALVLMTAALVRSVAAPDLVLLGTLGLLLLAGIVTPVEAFAGFSNPAVIIIGALFVVAAGIERTRALAMLDRLLRPSGRQQEAGVSVPAALGRMMPLTMGLSSVLNNTPVVAMLMTRVQEQARRSGLAASRLLIPLSYAAILGGMITLVGTSTNVIVHGLLLEAGLPGFRMFDFTWVGLPASALVLAYFLLGGWRTLPDRPGGRERLGQQLRDYHFDVRVSITAPFAGQTVEEAGLRTLGTAYLVHIRRGDRVIAAAPEEVLDPRDVLTFVGTPGLLETLLERPGLERTVEAVPVERSLRPVTDLVRYEAIVAPGSRLVGKSLRAADFRERFGGVVLAIQRRGEPLAGSLGRTPLRAGDLLLVEAGPGFESRHGRDREDFALVVPVDHSAAPASRRAPVALGLLVGMVVVATFGLVPLATAAFSAALAMILTGCLSASHARRAIDFSVLLVIAAALGVGRAVEATGLADMAAAGVTTVAAEAGPVGALLVLYLATNVLTELISNGAAAVLMFPVALSVAAGLGLDPTGLALTISIAASASFLTPIGYQTNLMVMGPGGYRYTDFTRVGLPVSLLVMAVTVTVVATVWI